MVTLYISKENGIHMYRMYPAKRIREYLSYLIETSKEGIRIPGRVPLNSYPIVVSLGHSTRPTDRSAAVLVLLQTTATLLP